MCAATDVWSGSMRDSTFFLLFTDIGSSTNPAESLLQVCSRHSHRYSWDILGPHHLTHDMMEAQHPWVERILYTLHLQSHCFMSKRLADGPQQMLKSRFPKKEDAHSLSPPRLTHSPPPCLSSYRINLKFLNLKFKVMLIWRQVTYLSRCQSLS